MENLIEMIKKQGEIINDLKEMLNKSSNNPNPNKEKSDDSKPSYSDVAAINVKKTSTIRQKREIPIMMDVIQSNYIKYTVAENKKKDQNHQWTLLRN